MSSDLLMPTLMIIIDIPDRFQFSQSCNVMAFSIHVICVFFFSTTVLSERSRTNSEHAEKETRKLEHTANPKQWNRKTRDPAAQGPCPKANVAQVA